MQGIKARGDFEVDISWEAGQIKSLSITSLKGKEFALRLNGEVKTKIHRPKSAEKMTWKF